MRFSIALWRSSPLLKLRLTKISIGGGPLVHNAMNGLPMAFQLPMLISQNAR